MSNQKPQIDKWILRPFSSQSWPGGPAGPFWGIVAQSGRVIALQIVEQQHAEILRIMGNLLAGDFDTTREIAERFEKYTYAPNSKEYMVRAVAEAILGLANGIDE